MNTYLLNEAGFISLNNDELYEIDGGSTKVAAGVVGVAAAVIGVVGVVCAVTNHPDAAAWCAVGAGGAALVAGVLGALPLP